MNKNFILRQLFGEMGVFDGVRGIRAQWNIFLLIVRNDITGIRVTYNFHCSTTAIKYAFGQ